MAPNDSSSVMLLSASATTANHVASPQHIHGASSWGLSRNYESHKHDNQVTHGAINHGNIHDLPLGKPTSARVVQSSVDSPSIVIPDNDKQSNKPLRKRAMKAKSAEECEDVGRVTEQPRMKKARLVVSPSSSEDKIDELHENDGEHQDTYGREEREERDKAVAMSEAELLMASCLLKLSHPKTSPGSIEKEENKTKQPIENVEADSQGSSPSAVPSSGSQLMVEDTATVPITPPSLLQSAKQMGPSMSWMPAASGPHTTAGTPLAVSATPASTMASAGIPFMDPATGACVAVPIMLPSLQQQQRQFMQTQNLHQKQRHLMQQQKLEQLHRATTRTLPHEASKGGMWMLDPAMSMATAASPAFFRRLPPSCYSSSSMPAWIGNKPNLVQATGGSLNGVMMRYNKENKAPSAFAHTIATPSSVSGVGSRLNPSLWVATKMQEEAETFHQMQEQFIASTDRKRKLMWSRQKYLEGTENPTEATEKPIVPEETASKSNTAGSDKTSKRFNNKTPKSAQEEEEEVIVDKPRPQDVLSGRGNGVALHDGNRQFRAWVKHYRLEYQQATRSCKGALTRRVIQHVHECGGRFLEQVVLPCSPSSSETSSLDDANGEPSTIQQTWRQLSNSRIWEKTSQALREKPNY